MSSTLTHCILVLCAQAMLMSLLLYGMYDDLTLDDTHMVFWCASVGIQYVMVLQRNAEERDHHFWRRMLSGARASKSGDEKIEVVVSSKKIRFVAHPLESEIWFRFILSSISNSLFSNLIIMLTPILLARASSAVNFVTTSFALTFIIGLDSDVIISRTQRVGRRMVTPCAAAVPSRSVSCP